MRRSLSTRRLVLLACVACVAVGLCGTATAGSNAAEQRHALGPAEADNLTATNHGSVSDPDELDGREAVRTDTGNSPYSAVGMITTTSDAYSPPSSVGDKQATGTLVSPYHVLTAAHLVTDDDANVEDEEYWFLPGLTETEDGDLRGPYGRAKVTGIDVWKDYDGHVGSDYDYFDTSRVDASDDLAVLTLDRPIGDYAGTMDVASATPGPWPAGGAYRDSFHILGYPAGDELVGGEVDGDSAVVKLDGHDTNVDVAGGDSGAPIFDWSSSTIYSVHSAHDSRSDAYAAPLAPERHDWVQDRIEADARPPSYAELHRADRVAWVPDGLHTVPTKLEADDPDGVFATTIYNAGTDASVLSTVEFYLVERFEDVTTIDGYLTEQPQDREPVCTAEPPEDFPALFSMQLHCEAETVDGFEPGDTPDVVPYFDGGVEHPAANERIHVPIDSVEIVEGDGDDAPTQDVSVAAVETPAEVAHTETFAATVAVANDGDAEATVDLEVDAAIDCEPTERRLVVGPGDETTVELDCAPSEGDAGTTEVGATVASTGEDPTELDAASATVEVVAPDFYGEVEMTDASYDGFTFEGPGAVGVEPGEDFEVTATLENVGDRATTRPIHFRPDVDCIDGHSSHYESRSSVSLAPGESTTVTFECQVTYDVAFEDRDYVDLDPKVLVPYERSATGGLSSDIERVAEHDPDLTDDAPFQVVPPQSPPDVTVLPPVEGPQTATVGEDVLLEVFVVNDGAPVNRTLTLERDGEPVRERTVRLTRDGDAYPAFTYTPADAGTHDLTFDTGDQEYEYPMEIEPAETAVEVVDAPDAVRAGAEPFRVEASVTGEAGTVTDETVTLSVDGETVATETVTLEGDQPRNVVLSAPVPDDAGDALSVSAATSTDEASTTVAVDGPAVQLTGVAVEDPAVGEPATVEASYANAGGAGETDVALEAVDPETGEHLATLDEATVAVDVDGHGVVELTATPDGALAGEVELVATTSGGSEHRRTVTVAPPAGAVSVELADVPDPVIHAATNATVEVAVTNGWDRPVEQPVSVTVDGVEVATPRAAVAAGATEDVTVEASVHWTEGDEIDFGASLGEARAEQTVPVAPPANVTLGEHEPAPYGDDGLYRDVDGDGSVGQGDVAVFFQYQHRDVVKENAPYFDFSGNGAVTHGDVVALFEYVALN